MSFIHNRTGIALCAAAAAVVLLGAGCANGKSGVSTTKAPATDAGAASATDAGSGILWIEYRSDALGIAIPYPKGWVVSENGDGSMDFFEHAPPAYSDAPSQMWILKREFTSVDAAIRAEFPTVYERREITRSGIAMTRIVYPYDARLDPDRRMAAYVWMESDAVRMIGGVENDEILEYAIDHLEVLP